MRRIIENEIKPISDGEISNVSPHQKERLIKRVKKANKKFVGDQKDETPKTKHIRRK